MPTLLHLSDLHRASDPYLTNDDLFAALVSDAERWDLEGVPRPDLIVVSGDLIQGAPRDAHDGDSELIAQYREAGDFLHSLCDAFLDSDRSRMVMVPGNHDVDWCRSLNAMTPLSECPKGIASKMLQPTSGLRWNWESLQAYEISNQRLYASRLGPFRQFRNAFYESVTPRPLSHGDRDLFFFEYPDLDVFVAGFSSWHGNDCFCRVGAIEPAALAQSQQLVANARASLGVAVWHHSITGGPESTDYMDYRVVHKLIDFGFVIGLHGHQHYPRATPFELNLPNLTSIAVIGAGSLAAGDNALPMGERRQFNIIHIDPGNESITVHVRGMSGSGVFTGDHREDFGGKTYTTMKLPSWRLSQSRSSPLRKLDDASTAIAEERYDDALALVAALPPDISPAQARQKRNVEINGLRSLGRDDELIELLTDPQNADEAVALISLLLGAGRIDDANVSLRKAKGLLDRSVFKELMARIAVAREMSQ